MQELTHKAAVLLKWDMLKSTEASQWLRCAILSTPQTPEPEITQRRSLVSATHSHLIDAFIL